MVTGNSDRKEVWIQTKKQKHIETNYKKQVVGKCHMKERLTYKKKDFKSQLKRLRIKERKWGGGEKNRINEITVSANRKRIKILEMHE